jgi:hypothetical protein
MPPRQHEGRSETATNPRSGAGESAGFSTDTAGRTSPTGEQPAPQASGSESDDGVSAPGQSARVVTRNIAREGLRLYPASWIIGRVATIDDDFAGVPVPAVGVV